MRLVVVDSIAAVFRHTFDDYLQRTRVLSCVALNLSRIANGHRLAVSAWGGVSKGGGVLARVNILWVLMT